MIGVIGENIVDLVTQEDGRMLPCLGGSPFNFAIGVGRQQVPCTYLSPVSVDGFGKQLREYAAANGVTVCQTMISSKPTSIAVVTFDENGSPSYSLYREGVADRDLHPQLIKESAPANLRIVHTGSLALVPQDLDRLTEILSELKQRGAVISLDVNVRVGVATDPVTYVAGIKTLFRFCKYVKASDEDLQHLYPEFGLFEAAEKILEDLDQGMVALTMGSSGARLLTKGRSAFREIIVPRIFRDTIGAGDTFFANLIAFLFTNNADLLPSEELSEEFLSGALRVAMTAASLNIEQQGCFPPDREELALRLIEVI